MSRPTFKEFEQLITRENEKNLGEVWKTEITFNRFNQLNSCGLTFKLLRIYLKIPLVKVTCTCFPHVPVNRYVMEEIFQLQNCFPKLKL